MTNQLTRYTPEYIEKCFIAWYGAGRPLQPASILEILPVDEFGRKPTIFTLRTWKLQWQARADDLDQKAIEQVDTVLINNKVKLLRQQAEDAFTLAQKAHGHLTTSGFDTSASAVQAYFKATEEIRSVIGLSEIMQRLGQLSDEDLLQEAMKRISRATNAGQTIEGVIEEQEENGGDSDN